MHVRRLKCSSQTSHLSNQGLNCLWTSNGRSLLKSNAMTCKCHVSNSQVCVILRVRKLSSLRQSHNECDHKHLATVKREKWSHKRASKCSKSRLFFCDPGNISEWLQLCHIKQVFVMLSNKSSWPLCRLFVDKYAPLLHHAE